MKFLTYNPEQAYLLPPSVREVLGEDHICFFVHQVVERLELSAFEQGYVEEGRPAYHPALLLKVWLYAYALGVTSARRLEQRVREDLAFRYLAAGAGPDFWTLNQFRTRHARALNDLFTQVVELARSLGMGRLGHVAMDSTRVAANASQDRVETVAKLRAERAKIRRQIRRWQKQCDTQSCEEAAGRQLSGKQMAALEKRLEEIPRCLERLRKSGLKRRSETDPDSRFLRDRKGFTLGLHGGGGGQRRSSDCRAARGAKRHRQRDAGPSGGGGRAALPGTPAEGQRRQRLLLLGDHRGTGPAWPGRLCARLELGAGTEPRPTRARSTCCTASGTSANATQAARPAPAGRFISGARRSWNQ